MPDKNNPPLTDEQKKKEELKKWEHLQQIRNFEEQQNKYLRERYIPDNGKKQIVGPALSTLEVVLETVSTVIYIKNGLKDRKGIIDQEESIRIEKYINENVPFGQKLIVRYEYERDLNTKLLKLNKKVGAEVHSGSYDGSDLKNGGTPYAPDPSLLKGYFIREVFGHKDIEKTEFKNPETKAQWEQEAQLIELCQKGLVDKICNTKDVKEMTTIMKDVQFLYDQALDKIPLDKIPAIMRAADPKTVEKINKRILRKSEENEEENEEEVVTPTPNGNQNTNPSKPDPTKPDPNKPDPGKNENPPPPQEPIIGDVPANPVTNPITDPPSNDVHIASTESVSTMDQTMNSIRANNGKILDYCLQLLNEAQGITTEPYQQIIPAGKIEQQYTINIDILRGLAAESENDWGLKGIHRFHKPFHAIFAASKEINDYFYTAVENGFDDEILYQLRRLYGYSKQPGKDLQSGDIIKLGDPMAEDGFNWAVVIFAKGPLPTEVLICAAKDKPYRVRQSNFGTVLNIWAPALCKVFDDDSPAGKFWGPGLSRIAAIFADNYIKQGDFITRIFGDMYDIKDYAGFFERLQQEIRSLSKDSPAVPGALVTNDAGGFGIVSRERKVFGYIGEPNSYHHVEWIHWRDFGARYVWYPHI